MSRCNKADYPANNPYENQLFTETIDGVMRPGGLDLTLHLVNCCKWPSGARIVDLGCGSGFSVELLQKRLGFKAVGFDISAELIGQGKRRTPDLGLFTAAAADLPFETATAEGVLAECTLSEFHNADSVWGEINRIMVVGGRIGIADIYIREPDFAAVLRSISGGSGCLSGVLTYQELVQKLDQHGFVLRSWEERLADWRGFIGSLIMTHGSLEAFWSEFSNNAETADEFQEKITLARLGYFCMVAEKIR